MIFRHFACLVVCVQRFMLAQKCRIGISESWPKFTFLLLQQIKFVLALTILASICKCPVCINCLRSVGDERIFNDENSADISMFFDICYHINNVIILAHVQPAILL